MRILQVCPYAMMRRGGVQAHVRDVAHWLTGAGHDVTILAPGPQEGTLGACAAPVVPLGRHVGVGLSGTRFEVTLIGPRELAAAVRRLDEDSIDVVHVHTPFVPFLPLQVWRAFRRPTVATFHATLPPGDRLLKAILTPVARAMARRAAAAIAVSRSAADLLGRDDPTRPIDILPPTIDLSTWRAAGEQTPKQAGNAPRRLLFLGRFEPRKGLGVLIDAWPEIVRRSGAVPVELVIAGGGELEPLARALVARDPGRVSIVPTPGDDDARRLVAEADLMVAPAPWGESFGLVLIEAMAAGTPVVAAANPGYASVLTGPGAALLVPPGDAGALAATVGDLLAAPDRLSELTAWGRGHIDRFDVAAVGPRLVDLYERVLTRLGRRPG